MAVLTVNAGSSSLKVSLVTDAGRVVDALGSADDVLAWADARTGGEALEVVGHRVVHGGERFTQPVLLDADTIGAIEALTPLAPLHQPHSLAAIHAIARARPELLQIACFDTAFHALSLVASTYALPKAMRDAGVRKYGFHGLSYEHIADRLRVIAPGAFKSRMIVAHLGSGASLCAMMSGTSLDTTMGFSVLDGLVMGTRPGATDPGILLYMERTLGMSPAAIEDALYHQSGLKGLSGSADMRDVAAMAKRGDDMALLVFAYRFGQQAAAMAASMSGVDGMVFTGGIGEHDAACRAACIRRCRWLGLSIIPDVNAVAKGETQIGGNVWVIPADEEAVIAKHAQAALRGDYALKAVGKPTGYWFYRNFDDPPTQNDHAPEPPAAR